MSREQYVNEQLTEIVAVLDGSCSMSSLVKSVTEGINAFVTEQAEQPGECFVSVYVFDSPPAWGSDSELAGQLRLELIRDRVNVRGFRFIDSSEYAARGNTPLNDAIMTVLRQTGEDFASRPFDQRPGNVVFFVSTDGEENDSKEFPGVGNVAVRDAISHQESQYAWHFIFTGSDVRAYEQGEELGVDVSNVLNYVASEEGTKALYSGISNKIGQLRRGEVRSCAFTAEEKALVEDLEDDSDPLASTSLSVGTSTLSTDESSD